MRRKRQGCPTNDREATDITHTVDDNTRDSHGLQFIIIHFVKLKEFILDSFVILFTVVTGP
jgi:hypothetical protein